MTDTDLLTQLRTQFSSAHWPHFDGLGSSEHRFVIDISIADDMHWLAGHFPHQPVVAGVVQTHWAGEVAKYLFHLDGEFVRIDNLKFQQVMLPGQRLQLTLDCLVTGTVAIKFCYRHGETIFSEGRFIFSNPDYPAQ